MSDPLGSAVAGQFSPFVTSAGTVNAALDVLRFARQGVRGATGAAGSPIDPLSPQTLVWVRNDTGGDLAARAVVALGEPTFDWTLDSLVHEARRNPTFPGTAPAAATDPFAVLIEPAGDGQIARAAVLGVVPVDLDVQDSGDTHASPESAVTDTLTTGTSGPARIIWKESGTGEKRGAVLLTGQAGGGSASVTAAQATYTSSTTLSTSAETDVGGMTLSLPSAGDYLLFAHLNAYGEVTGAMAGTGWDVPYIQARITKSDDSYIAGDAWRTVVAIPVLDNIVSGSTGWTVLYTAAGATDLKMRAQRYAPIAPTWVTSVVASVGFGTTFQYLKIS